MVSINDIRIVITGDMEKIERQLQALKYQIEHDLNDKDKEIHTKALKDLIEHRRKLISQNYTR